MTIGNRLKKIRVEAGMTQQGMADILGIGKTAFNKIEAGKVDITLRHLLKITGKFQISLDWLVLGKGDKAQVTTFGEHNGTVSEMLNDMENDLGFLHGVLSNYHEMKHTRFYSAKQKEKELKNESR